MEIANFIKNLDIFGHKVGLHFGQSLENKKDGEQEYKTLIGGFCSILVKAAFYGILIYYGLIMYNR